MTEYTVHFTSHHNWDWVLKEAIQSMCCERVDSELIVKFCDLPVQKIKKSKPTYSLFRLNITSPNRTTLINTDATSLSFAHLDPKDALYKDLALVNAQQCMPQTTLFDWDAEVSIPLDEFPSQPAMLKAALGSGGFGLYFVYSNKDIVEVMKAHKARAERTAGFVDQLKRDYGDVPAWSLQQVVRSVRMTANDNRKCQLRAYLVECNGQLYLYDTYEVRVPCWDIDLDAVLAEEQRQGERERQNVWSVEVENECCGAGNARPYNEKRNKSKTERYLLEEVPDLEGSAEAIRRTLLVAMGGLRDGMLSRRGQSALSSSGGGCGVYGNSSMAIAGIDLLVSRSPEGAFSAYIVEMNNNPAMPGSTKHMSGKYRAHLVTMVGAILRLGIRAAVESGNKSGEPGEWADLPAAVDPAGDGLNRWERV